jgi:hypothetical protein
MVCYCDRILFWYLIVRLWSLVLVVLIVLLSDAFAFMWVFVVNLSKGVEIMDEKQKKGFFMMSFNKLLVLFFILAMVGCGDGDSSDETTPVADPSAPTDPSVPTVPTDPSVPVVTSSVNLETSLAAGTNLAQGGTTTVTATVYNNGGTLVADGTEVVFTASSGIITGAVPTVSGRAIATYNAASAGGNVTITAVAGDVTSQISLTVASGPAAWIQLVSITPDHLGLKGSGFDEVGVITFNVKDSSGNSVDDGTPVDFTLNSPTGGGEYLSTVSALTVDGKVAVSLVSGTVGGVATITASTNNEATTVSTEARVTMGSGKPDQLHLSIFFDELNVPGQFVFNYMNKINAAVADRNSNPVPATTPVYFASECGIVSLDSNLTNANGVTSVDWITANPVDKRCTSIIWTEGEEAYIDNNANGVYDEGDSHTDIGEPYIDANESATFDSGEVYFDLDGNGVYTQAEADPSWNDDTFVWISGVVAWSGRTESTKEKVFSPTTFNVATGSPQSFAITIADTTGGPLTEGSSAKITTNCPNSALTGDTDITIPDTVFPGPLATDFSVTLKSTDGVSGDAVPCTLTVEITADPNGNRTTTIDGTID